MNKRSKNEDELPQPKKSFWEKLPWWTWLIVGIVIVGIIGMIVIYNSGTEKSGSTESTLGETAYTLVKENLKPPGTYCQYPRGSNVLNNPGCGVGQFCYWEGDKFKGCAE